MASFDKVDLALKAFKTVYIEDLKILFALQEKDVLNGEQAMQCAEVFYVIDSAILKHMGRNTVLSEEDANIILTNRDDFIHQYNGLPDYIKGVCKHRKDQYLSVLNDILKNA